MLRFIDISHWQNGIDVAKVSGVDAVICKATEGTGYVDSNCDRYIQAAKKRGMPWGVYHFGGHNNAQDEADYFMRHCEGYIGSGVLVLDWEQGQTETWVNSFVRRVHDKTGIWPWVYASQSMFKNKMGVEPNCMRWVAQYPAASHPSFNTAKKWKAPDIGETVGAWQFCSDGRIDGYSGDVDCSLFYGDDEAWAKYAGSKTGTKSENGIAILENEEYTITVKRKGTGK